MFRTAGFVFLSCLAIGAGVAAVSVPVEGQTIAEHVRGLVEERPAPKAKAAPKAPAPAVAKKSAAKAPKDAAPARPVESDPTEAEKAALDALIGGRASR